MTALFVRLAASHRSEARDQLAAPRRARSGGSTTEEGKREHVREKKLLLVLDNFEQVLEGAQPVARLLAACPDLKVLVTSRIPLGIYGREGVPGTSPLLTRTRAVAFSRAPHPIRGREALYREGPGRETRVLGNQRERPAVAEVCARLDGIPLAIELAAARVKGPHSSEDPAQAQRPLEAAGRGARDLPERQRTLRASLEWSHALLEEGERCSLPGSLYCGGTYPRGYRGGL